VSSALFILFSHTSTTNQMPFPKYTASFIAFFMFHLVSWSQYEHKETHAKRCIEAPVIDGHLDESCWQHAPAAMGFIIDSPHPGKPLEQNTEVKIVYDDEAIYIAFMNYDDQPDSILTQLSGRDSDGNSDYCGITFSCYNDGINGNTFIVTPKSEQWDARVSAATGEDVSWNAVWYAKCRIVENGWTAEFKIPFAALRFPDIDKQEWGINFVREVRRTRHHSFWRGVNPLQAGFLTQMGKLLGIENIKPPKRLFFYPYASYYQNFVETEDGVKSESSWNAGMDLKLGLNDAFTLDATLVPDFGQVISDQQILNLSPFEVQFQDNRQFFIEGTELFSKAGIFYTRRVGYLQGNEGSLYNLKDGESYSELPQQLQLLNASKISGRNQNGLGIGFFNAVTAKAQATVVDSLGNKKDVDYYPLANYNVVVLDQNLRNNSFVSLINTNLLRNGSMNDANVTAVEFDLRNKKNEYSITGTGAYNVKFGPDWKGVDERDGFSQSVALNRISGKWLATLGTSVESDTYDPTDMGFLQANNSFNYFGNVTFQQRTPFGRFNNFTSDLYLNYNQLYKPNHFTDITIESDSYLTTKGFTTYNLNISSMPSRGYDFFEPRIWGRTFRTYTYNSIGGWISTDYRKPVALDLGSWFMDYENPGRYVANLRISPRFRVNDHLFITYVYSWQNHFNDLGFASFYEDEPLFGRRDVISHTNVLTVNYAFNPIMNMSCRVRHYWGYSKYREFFRLEEDGYLSASDFEGFVNEDGENTAHSSVDRNFNSFTVDLVYRWIFTPGSELTIVWKNAIIQSQFGDPVPVGLRDDLDFTFRQPQQNSISLKVLYFLDYNMLVRKKR
jgi:hypothetical protein